MQHGEHGSLIRWSGAYSAALSSLLPSLASLGTARWELYRYTIRTSRMTCWVWRCCCALTTFQIRKELALRKRCSFVGANAPRDYSGGVQTR
jgi:hypothetical protein